MALRITLITKSYFCKYFYWDLNSGEGPLSSITMTWKYPLLGYKVFLWDGLAKRHFQVVVSRSEQLWLEKASKHGLFRLEIRVLFSLHYSDCVTIDHQAPHLPIN